MSAPEAREAAPVQETTGAARRARERHRRSLARKVLWITGLCQDSKSHHTGGGGGDSSCFQQLCARVTALEAAILAANSDFVARTDFVADTELVVNTDSVADAELDSTDMVTNPNLVNTGIAADTIVGTNTEMVANTDMVANADNAAEQPGLSPDPGQVVAQPSTDVKALIAKYESVLPQPARDQHSVPEHDSWEMDVLDDTHLAEHSGLEDQAMAPNSAIAPPPRVNFENADTLVDQPACTRPEWDSWDAETQESAPVGPQPTHPQYYPALQFRSYESADKTHVFESCSSVEFARCLRDSFCDLSRASSLSHAKQDHAIASYWSQSDKQLLAQYAQYRLAVQAKRHSCLVGKDSCLAGKARAQAYASWYSSLAWKGWVG